MSENTLSQSAEGLMILLKLRGIGPQTAMKLSERFARIGEIQKASDRELLSLANSRVVQTIRDSDAWLQAYKFADAQIDQAATFDVRVLSIYDESYPRLLAAIPDAPAILYVKGELPGTRETVACVGSREPSVFGSEVARRITRKLAESGFSIVSGLALGVDSICHEAALDCGGHTVGILANGLDSVYPAKNRELAERILSNGGALVSEQPFGVKAFAQNLVQRDRLQSGFSRATFVMQTDIVGGTMHTVRFTLMQGRLLFVPAPTVEHAEEPKFRGPRALAERTGAELAELVGAKNEYASLLVEQFGDRPVAFCIRSHADYEEMFLRLGSAAECPPVLPNPGPKQEQLFDTA